jgi:uncharacterized DUF497 family protein
MKFVWDDDKAASNVSKHSGVSFDEAVETFYDAQAIEAYDDANSTESEKRFTRIGLSTRRLLLVVFIDLTIDEAGDATYRIISARKAERDEVKLYEEFNRA